MSSNKIYKQANEIRQKLLLFIDKELYLSKKLKRNQNNKFIKQNEFINNSTMVIFEQTFSHKSEGKLFMKTFSQKRKSIKSRTNLHINITNFKIEQSNNSTSTSEQSPIKTKNRQKPSQSISKLLLHQKTVPVEIQNILSKKKATKRNSNVEKNNNKICYKLDYNKITINDKYNTNIISLKTTKKEELIENKKKKEIQGKKYLKNKCFNLKKTPNKKKGSIFLLTNLRRKSVDIKFKLSLSKNKNKTRNKENIEIYKKDTYSPKKTKLF